MTTLDRIKDLCEKQNLKVYNLEAKLGYSNGAISKPKEISPTRLAEIAQYFGVSTDYLITGKEPNLSDEAAYLNLEILKDKELQESLKKYFALSEKEQSHVRELIDLLSR